VTVDPTSSPSHSIGSSDGRCVQRAGTYSAWANDPRLRGIPSCTSNSHKARSPARMRFHRITQASRQRRIPIGRISVARVRPRTSKGITDLLLPDTSTHYSAGSPHDWARASFPDQSPHMRQTPTMRRSATPEGARPKPQRTSRLEMGIVDPTPTTRSGLVRYRNQPDELIHELRTAMHHHP
jgi:hypothetical protein